MQQKGLEQSPFDESQHIIYSNLSDNNEGYPEEWLPSMSLLSGDMRYLLEDKTNRKWRIEVASEYVDELRSRIPPEEFSVVSESYAAEQVSSRLFLDSLALIIKQQIYFTGTARYGRHAAETFEDLKKLLATKREMQGNMANYMRFHPDVQGQVLFSNLWGTMNHARRLVYNDEVTSEKSGILNAKNLLGMLAENKVVSALQENGWPLADHSTVEQDSDGADVIIPVGDYDDSAVMLQVKTHDQKNDLLFIHPVERTPIVVIPMNLAINDPFKLNRFGTGEINEFIHTAPRTRLELAA